MNRDVADLKLFPVIATVGVLQQCYEMDGRESMLEEEKKYIHFESHGHVELYVKARLK